MKITELINKNLVITELKGASKIDVIKEMANKLGDNVSDVTGFIDDVLAREKQTSTGIGKGIAIPHAKSKYISKATIVLAKSSQGIDYDAIDEKPVHLLFLLAVPDGNNSEHLKILSKLSKLLLNEEFQQKLLNANSAEDIIDVLNFYESGSTTTKSTSSLEPPKVVNLVAVTACPTGIAHTFMAQEALEKAAKDLGVNIKVETNGASGVENELTNSDIKNADAVILAINRNVETARFKGKRLIKVGAQEAINGAEELIKKVVAGGGSIFTSEEGSANKTEGAERNSTGSSLSDFYKHLMSGVSYMLPFVISGGILIALAFLLDKMAGVSSGSGLGSTTYLAKLFMSIGKEAFALFVPVLAAFIAFSIANRAALTAGLVGGALASVGGGGFFGAIIAGFIAGYITKWLVKMFKNTPKSIDGIKNILIFPILTVIITGVLMIVLFNTPIKFINDSLLNWLNSMGSVNKVLLGLILGGMMAIDMGGPFNKAAYIFGVASLATGPSAAMAAVMAGGMVPPLAIALAGTFFKDKFSVEQREATKTNYIMGLSFITEGAIPFVASDPFRMIPICIAGSSIAGALTMYFGVNLPSPHGGIIVMLLSNHVFYYLLALAIGSIFSAILIGLLRKKV